MKIRTALKLTSAIAIIMMVGSVVGSALSFKWLREASTFEVLLMDLQRDIFDRTMFRDEYLHIGRQQALQRWFHKSAEIERHIKHLEREPLSPNGSLLLARIDQYFQATKVLLPRIADLRATEPKADPLRMDPMPAGLRLTNQLFVDAYLLSDTTRLMLLEARSNTIHARNRLLLLLTLTTLTLGLTVTGTTVYLNRLVSHRVADLIEGTDSLANGKFEYRILVDGEDELASLARGVNGMAVKLQRSYGLLETTNRELEAFSYSVSHDLRAPLRHLTGFVELLDRMDTNGLDEKSRHYLDIISSSAKKMGCLIDDLLSFSRMGRAEMMTRSVDLQQLAQEVIEEVSRDLPPGRVIQWRLGDLPVATGDRAMLRLALVNLIANAVKFSQRSEAPVIEVGALPPEKGCHTLFVRDNGAGFNMKYVDKLFGLFQRLHSSEEYEGTGVGLANVRRIITRHDGKIWAEGELNKGATFYFTLPIGTEVQS